MVFKRFFAGCVFSMLFAWQTFAFDVPAYEDYVTDLAEVISAERELEIENQITEIEKTTTAEIAVLTVKTTDDIDIFDYTYEVASNWGVGKKENDNGLMIVIAVDDRKWFMATGYGLEGTLPDATLKRIGERNYPPNFRQGDYAQGVEDTLHDIEKYLLNDPTIVASYDSSSSASYDSTFQDESTTLAILTILAFFLIPLKSIWVRKEKKKRTQRSIISTILIFLGFLLSIHVAVGVIFSVYSLICDWAEGGTSGGSSGSGWSSGSSWSSGSGWSSGGSSFGGFSGGSFGGGGAGGGW